jgi:RNA polymerase sigma-70 factor, ECF subfamily
MTIRGEAPSEGPTGAGRVDLTSLLTRIAAGDATAFAALYRQTSSELYGVVARIATRGDVAADCLQETYVRIWRKAYEFDPLKGSPLAWMATIARNCALDEVRRVRSVSLEDMDFEPAAKDIDPLAMRERSERLSALVDCLKALDEEKRAVVLLAYYRGLSREAPGAASANNQDLAPSQPGAAQGLPRAMTISPDDDFAAAEFALGTLGASERASGRRWLRGGCASLRSTRRSETGRRGWRARRGGVGGRPAARSSPRDRGAHSRRAFEVFQPKCPGVRQSSRLSVASDAGAPWRSLLLSLLACW